MTNNRKSVVITVLMACFLLVFSVWCFLKTPDTYSDSERRALASMPELSVDSALSAEFMGDFETYATDQFPLRDGFRKLKAWSQYHLFGRLDNNQIYQMDGHLAKLEYPLNPQMLDHAAERFTWIYEKFLKEQDMNVYLSIVPDKNMFLAAENGYPALDYDELERYMTEKLSFMEYIDLYDMLSKDDYYRTDTHWKQENLVDIAEAIGGRMGITLDAEYTEQVSEHPFYGVFYGQAAVHAEPDVLKFLTNDVLENCIVTSYDTGKPVQVPLYDMAAAAGKDPYEMFTSGSDALVTIENPSAETDRELILFRDSFGSSLAPLLVDGYAKVTLVDTRYVQSAMLGNFIEFDDQDVLFLYSTMMLNSSLGLR